MTFHALDQRLIRPGRQCAGVAEWPFGGEAQRRPRWLLRADDTGDTGRPVDACSRRFVNAHRLDFQDAADERSDILFARASDVNTWCVVWRRDGRMNVLSLEQG